MVQKSKVLYSKNRVGFAIANLAQFNVFIGNYKEAALNAKNAQQFHIPNSFNHLTLKEQEFFAHFYGHNLKDALKCIEEMLDHLMVDAGIYRKSKFVYFQAFVLFVNQNYSNALKLLNKSLEIEKDKAGWNIALRILLIMIYIQLNKNQEAKTTLLALEKHIQRTGKVKELNKRDISIVKLIHELEKDNFKRNEKNKTVSKLIKELSDKNGPVAWNYYTPELVPFHEWVLSLPIK